MGERPSVAVIGTRGYPSYYGGLETAVRKLAPFLAERGWEVTVHGRAGTTRPDDPARDPRVRTVAVWAMERKSLSNLSSGLASTVRLVRDPPDAALVMSTAVGFWLPLLRLRRIPTVVNTDGIEWERDKWGRLAKAVLFAGAWMTARFGDELVFDAHAIEAYWARRFHRSGHYIPYGGEPHPAPAPPEGLRRGEYILLVARFVPENTVAEFLVAAERLAADHPVVLVGSTGWGGALDDDAARLAASTPAIRWLGHVSDEETLNGLYANAGVYFHGHSVGGTNPSLVQAMASGIPIVARDTVYNREVLGETGVFCDPDPASIESAIRAVMDDPDARSRLGRDNQLRAQTMFTWDGVCGEYERVLRLALSRGRSRPR